VKLVIAWFTVAIVAVVTASSCSIHHATGDYTCTTQADCSGGRVCSDGYCVVGPGGPIDAPRPIDARSMIDARLAPDALVCPPQCSSCNAGQMTCRIDCAVTSCTNGSAVVCPPGWNCEVLCTTPSSCRNGVSCAGTLSCDVQCTGTGSCRGVACGAGPCNVDCAGSNACRGVQCGTSCACDVTCSNGALCGEVACPSFQCSNVQGGCSSASPGCDTCP
jgi:hypothetical protein